jgi:hypothetical protein
MIFPINDIIIFVLIFECLSFNVLILNGLIIVIMFFFSFLDVMIFFNTLYSLRDVTSFVQIMICYNFCHHPLPFLTHFSVSLVVVMAQHRYF